MDALLGEDGLLTSLLNLGGITVPARTRFIASTVTTTTYSSLTFGLFSGLVGAATPMGPLVPFLSGCWMGYSFGVYAVWRSAKMMAVRCAERYPKLLAHALEMEFGVCVPRECVNAPPLTSNFPISEKRIEKIDDNTMSTSTWKNPRDDYERSINYSISMHPLALWICNGGAGRLSWAILAAQECQRSIIELERDQRDQIVEANYKNMMDDNE